MADVEKSFELAISTAREQSAKTFELRAATDLAKLWTKQNKSREAYDLLKEVYDWFKEGSDTVDMKEARVTLEQLKT
jgi:predicted ATPase